MNEKPKTILIIEDEKADIKLARYALEGAGILNPICEIMDGEDALNFLLGRGGCKQGLEQVKLGLILLDLKLPKVSGLEILKIIRGREELRDIPVVVVTVSDLAVDTEMAYELGATSYLVKPLLPEHIKELARSLSLVWPDLFVMRNNSNTR